jgi:hypothetical protein
MALGTFRTPELRHRALAYNLAGPLRPQELFWIPEAMTDVPRQQDEVWAWWEEHYDELAKRMPPEYGAFVPIMAQGCSESRLKSAEAFFADPKHSPPGTQGTLAKMAEATRDCMGLRGREGDAVTRTLMDLAQAP